MGIPVSFKGFTTEELQGLEDSGKVSFTAIPKDPISKIVQGTAEKIDLPDIWKLIGAGGGLASMIQLFIKIDEKEEEKKNKEAIETAKNKAQGARFVKT